MKCAVIFCVLLGFPISTQGTHEGDELMRAECRIEPTSGNPDVPVYGSVILSQVGEGHPVYISVALGGFDLDEPNRRHGFHIHENGDLGDECTAAGGHFKRPAQVHGAPTDRMRHWGDLGNLEANQNGQVSFSTYDTRISLADADRFSVIGKAIVVHAGEDDLGRGGDPGSGSTGNAGGRLGCCIITSIP